ncbi:MAG: cyclic nucleotide-binding domain-containing protein [Alphaproteobacteria bacterium]|nr:cyclic nucleotide-binding domain-containing protein [Alphaproteobacteria bacterium]
MQLTLEKVLVLKNVPLFQNIPETVLADIISASEEISFVQGTDIINNGDNWNDLYIILNGQVSITKNGKVVSELSNYDIFGEIAALNPTISDLTITAIEDTFVYKISGFVLYRLMNEHKALERSIIISLCQRIRDLESKLDETI